MPGSIKGGRDDLELENTINKNGLENLKFAKSKKAKADGNTYIFGNSELKQFQQDEGQNKMDQLLVLNRKVRQFEEKVARDEMLIRHKQEGGGGAG